MANTKRTPFIGFALKMQCGTIVTVINGNMKVNAGLAVATPALRDSTTARMLKDGSARGRDR